MDFHPQDKIFVMHYELYELNSLVSEAVEASLPEEYWVAAELSEVRVQKGHCYMELVQKDPLSNIPVARASAKCWRNTWQIVQPYFERVTGQPVAPGINVLLKVYAQFHVSYGFSWIVSDIDPSFTLGDMARKRREIVRILKEQGVFDLNKELGMPLFAQRIAVISAETAAGYGDFCSQLASNSYKLAFTTELFPAVMQGERVERSIIDALDRINERSDDFDCVVIIRGGGATSDLSGFDSLALAENVANFPLPVITGIGHERDETVIDMVANMRLKTPTAVAAFLIEHLSSVLMRVDGAQRRMTAAVRLRMDSERARLSRLSDKIPVLVSLASTRRRAHLAGLSSRLNVAARASLSRAWRRLDVLSASLAPATSHRIATERHRLQLLAQRADAADPARLLLRGYSITYCNGHAVRDTGEVGTGDVLSTHLANGVIESVVS